MMENSGGSVVEEEEERLSGETREEGGRLEEVRREGRVGSGYSYGWGGVSESEGDRRRSERRMKQRETNRLGEEYGEVEGGHVDVEEEGV